jgi:ABC-type polysaccharide/polyol phosphate transport system ATPase subunit
VAPAIAFEDVHKRYRIYQERYRSLKEMAIHRRLGVWEERWALRGVSLAVEPGSTLGLVGSNGAGKSTALKLMARILTPDRGRVRVNGRLSALIELGAGFQLEYTGRENVYLNASLMGLSRREVDRRLDEIVSFAELEDHIDAPLRTYSSGMYMRLGFSVAIHVDPEILLVDEILAVGDEAFQHKCMEWLEAFQRRGGTIVMVTHDLGAVREVCTQAAWIENGQLADVGPPDDVIGAYLDQVRGRRRDVEDAQRALAERLPDVELSEVQLLGRHGRPIRVVERGDPLQIAISYRCHRRLETPVVGVALHRRDGTLAYATNTHIDGVDLGPIERDGALRLRYRSLPLLGGAYLVSVGVFADPDPHAVPVDHHGQRYSFQLVPRTAEQGIAYIEHDWVLESGEERKQSAG